MNSKKHFLLLTVLTMSTSCMLAKGWFSNPEQEAYEQMQKDLLRIQLEKEIIDLELKRKKLLLIQEEEQAKQVAQLMEAKQKEEEQKSQEHRTQRILNAYDALSNPAPKSLQQRMHSNLQDLTDMSNPGDACKIAWAPYAPMVIAMSARLALELVCQPTLAKVAGTLSDDISTKLADSILKKLGKKQKSPIQEFVESVENPTEVDQDMIEIIKSLDESLPNDQLPHVLLELIKHHNDSNVLREIFNIYKQRHNSTNDPQVVGLPDEN